MMILLAGMQGIPPSSTRRPRSTARRGGRTSWRITLPLLRRSIALSLIISVIGSFLAFNQFFILTAQNGHQPETVVEWVYQTAFAQIRRPGQRDVAWCCCSWS